MYHDYEIYLNPDWVTSFDRWVYVHKDYDGDEDSRHGTGFSAEDCKEQIDDV
jgi:hypothetical protein